MKVITIEAEYVYNQQSLVCDMPKPVTPIPENAVQVDFTGSSYVCYVDE